MRDRCRSVKTHAVDRTRIRKRIRVLRLRRIPDRHIGISSVADDVRLCRRDRADIFSDLRLFFFRQSRRDRDFILDSVHRDLVNVSHYLPPL